MFLIRIYVVLYACDRLQTGPADEKFRGYLNTTRKSMGCYSGRYGGLLTLLRTHPIYPKEQNGRRSIIHVSGSSVSREFVYWVVFWLISWAEIKGCRCTIDQSLIWDSMRRPRSGSHKAHHPCVISERSHLNGHTLWPLLTTVAGHLLVAVFNATIAKDGTLQCLSAAGLSA